MADVQFTTYTAGSSVTRKPDVYDFMTNISPDETPFLSMIGRAKASNTTHQWPKDKLRAPAKNAQVEGAKLDAKALVMPTMESNYTQRMEFPFAITDTQKAMKHYGMGDPVTYYTKKSLKEFALDMEFGLVNNKTKVAGDDSTARELIGLKGCITTNVEDFSGSFAAGNVLTEEIFNKTMQKAKQEGGNPTKVLCPYTQKGIIDKFDGFNQLTKNIDSKAKTVVASVDFYNGSFGTVQIMLHRHIEQETSTKKYDTMYFVEPERFKLAPLLPVKTEKLARDRTADKYLLSAEFSLEFLAEEGSAKIEKLYDPQQV